MNYKFSVIIPTFQRKDIVVSNIIAFQNQDFKESFEVICIVDGSNDGTYNALMELKTAFPFTVIYQNNEGAARARNAGAKIARGEYLFFIDDDMEAHPSLLSEHNKSILENGANIVAGYFENHPDSVNNFLSKRVRLWSESRKLEADKLTIIELLSGQFSIKRELFWSIGGFDDSLYQNNYGYEDWDLAIRLNFNNHSKFLFNPKAISYQKYDVPVEVEIARVEAVGKTAFFLERKYADFQLSIPTPFGDKFKLLRLFLIQIPFLWDSITYLLSLVSISVARKFPKSSITNKIFVLTIFFKYWKGVKDAENFQKQNKIRVLNYHSVSYNINDPIYGFATITPKLFEQQIRVLKKAGFNFITPIEFLNFLTKGTRLPKRAISVTFDDGYQDFLDNAFPILIKESISPIIFVVYDYIGKFNYWDTANGGKELKLLSIKDLRYLEKQGCMIGCHSKSHPDLRYLSLDEITIQVKDTKKEFVLNGLNEPVLFAYPYGCFNDLVVKSVSKAGYIAAFTTDSRSGSSFDNPFLFPRFQISQNDIVIKLILNLLTNGKFYKFVNTISDFRGVKLLTSLWIKSF